MNVYELVGNTASIDWATGSRPRRIGLFTSRKKAEARVAEIKRNDEWRMDWDGFGINKEFVE